MALWCGWHLAPPRSASVRSPVPIAGHCWPLPPQETLKTQKQVWLSLLWDPWVLVLIRFCLSPLSVSRIWNLILNLILPFLPSPWGSCLALGCGFFFFFVWSNILLLMVVQQLVAILVFLQMSVHLSTPPSLVKKDELFTQYFCSDTQSSRQRVSFS